RRADIKSTPIITAADTSRAAKNVTRPRSSRAPPPISRAATSVVGQPGRTEPAWAVRTGEPRLAPPLSSLSAPYQTNTPPTTRRRTSRPRFMHLMYPLSEPAERKAPSAPRGYPTWPMREPPVDGHGRRISDLRVSLTD